MSEHTIVSQTPSPRTRASLAAEFGRLGLKPGMTVLVHSSLSSLGWVSGGPVAVIQALMDLLTPEGTLAMPAHSGEYSDPAKWVNPPVPVSWIPEIRANMPAFDPAYTPTRSMGLIAETFRKFPGVLRSSHPAVSFAAWGKHAGAVTSGHALAYCLGETSPLARLYDLDSWVLLLGVGYDNNTAFHLSEYRAPDPTPTQEGAPVFENGQRIWKTYPDIEADSSSFSDIGADFEWSGQVILGEVGSAQARLFRIRPAVDFATQWLTEKRKYRE